MNNSYELLIIGAGPAGVTAALRAAELGASRVAVVDKSITGGTCTNTGCVPTRVLAKTARLLRDISKADAYGIEVAPPVLNWSQTKARVQHTVAVMHRTKRDQERISAAGGSLFLEGRAAFEDAHTIRLADSGRVVHAEKIIVCVGGHSRRLPIPGIEHALFPEEILNLDELPRRVAIVGSGYTGVQLATVMNAFGAQVTLLETKANVLPEADYDTSQVLSDSFRRQNINVQTDINRIESIAARSDNTRELIYSAGGETHRLMCDAVIMCTGWPANVAGLDLERAGVAVENGFLKLNQYLQTNVPHIFAAGDVNGQAMLVQGAHFEAQAAAENALRPDSMRSFSHSVLPTGGFTEPEHAGVGLTEQQARERYPDCLIAVAKYAELERAIIDNCTTGFFKLLVERETRCVLGAHAAGENAVEIIQAIAIAMVAKIKINDLVGVELSYPTYSAIIGFAARRLTL